MNQRLTRVARRVLHDRRLVHGLDRMRLLSAVRGARRATFHIDGYRYGATLSGALGTPLTAQTPSQPNPFEEYLESYDRGPGVWKPRHYLPIYHRHFAKLIGREVNILEIGVYSGGSLRMWRDYFGRDTRIFGVDIEPACKSYEDSSTRIFIGDQGDPSFWATVIPELPRLDIVLDDGSHEPPDQIVTLKALLPQLRPGGIYLCEDIGGDTNPFHDYLCGLARNLHFRGGPTTTATNAFQQAIASLHFYPWVAVIERSEIGPLELSALAKGDVWAAHLEPPENRDVALS